MNLRVGVALLAFASMHAAGQSCDPTSWTQQQAGGQVQTHATPAAICSTFTSYWQGQGVAYTCNLSSNGLSLHGTFDGSAITSGGDHWARGCISPGETFGPSPPASGASGSSAGKLTTYEYSSLLLGLSVIGCLGFIAGRQAE